MKLSKKDAQELNDLKQLLSSMEDRVKRIEKNHNIAWIIIFICMMISLLAVFQIQNYNWAWTFLVINPFLNFFLVSSTHLDLDIIYDYKRIKNKINNIEMKEIDI